MVFSAAAQLCEGPLRKLGKCVCEPKAPTEWCCETLAPFSPTTSRIPFFFNRSVVEANSVASAPGPVEVGTDKDRRRVYASGRSRHKLERLRPWLCLCARLVVRALQYVLHDFRGDAPLVVDAVYSARFGWLLEEDTHFRCLFVYRIKKSFPTFLHSCLWKETRQNNQKKKKRCLFINFFLSELPFWWQLGGRPFHPCLRCSLLFRFLFKS